MSLCFVFLLFGSIVMSEFTHMLLHLVYEGRLGHVHDVGEFAAGHHFLQAQTIQVGCELKVWLERTGFLTERHEGVKVYRDHLVLELIDMACEFHDKFLFLCTE